MHPRKQKIVSGNYSDVMRVLTLPSEAFSAAQEDEKEYLATVKRDLPRIPLFCTLANRAQLLTKLKVLPADILSFTQGNFEGRIFTTSARIKSEFYVHDMEYWLANTNQCLREISFAYLNDDGIPCAFALEYFRDISQKNKKYFFNLALITNSVAAPQDRKVVFVSDEALLPIEARTKENLKKMAGIDKKKLLSVVKKTLHSKTVFEFLQPIFTEPDKDAFVLCEALKVCFDKPQGDIAFYFNEKKAAKVNALIFSGFELELRDLYEKASDLEMRGHIDASQTVYALHKLLITNREAYLDGKIELDDFVQYSKDGIKTASSTQLQHDRQTFGKLFNRLLKLLEKLTCSLVTMKPTDTMVKINMLSHSLVKLSIFNPYLTLDSFKKKNSLIEAITNKMEARR
jgi:hypothetical protein